MDLRQAGEAVWRLCVFALPPHAHILSRHVNFLKSHFYFVP